jgi:hypothetical protein
MPFSHHTDQHRQRNKDLQFLNPTSGREVTAISTNYSQQIRLRLNRLIIIFISDTKNNSCRCFCVPSLTRSTPITSTLQFLSRHSISTRSQTRTKMPNSVTAAPEASVQAITNYHPEPGSSASHRHNQLPKTASQSPLGHKNCPNFACNLFPNRALAPGQHYLLYFTDQTMPMQTNITKHLTPRSAVSLQKPSVAQLVKFTTDGSLPCSKDPARGFCFWARWIQCISRHHVSLLSFSMTIPSTPRSPKFSSPQVFLPKCFTVSKLFHAKWMPCPSPPPWSD